MSSGAISDRVLRNPQPVIKLWLMIKLAAALLLAAAACGDDAHPYPTVTFHERTADGRTVATFGGYAGDVCEAIAAAACDSQRCILEYFARCNPIGRDGVIAYTSVDRWDAAWSTCLAAASASAAAGYAGKDAIGGCDPLTPFWR